MGCTCHEHLIKNAGSNKTRSKSLRRDLEDKTSCCPWMGRRGVRCAAGHCDGMFSRVRSATSPSHHQMLFAVDSVTAGRMMQIKSSITERWCSVVADKLGFWNHVPHKVVG
eukprot:9164360-Pyramimonas_sp.AAC.1